uniref:Lamin L3 n=1 Tax=Cynoglossus semilaevis TaxID=244447 RepID=A0A3P8VHY1_CYNSE
MQHQVFFKKKKVRSCTESRVSASTPTVQRGHVLGLRAKHGPRETEREKQSERAVRRTAAHTPCAGPNTLLRKHEKDELRQLNDRLANYIQRVQELESERASVLLQLEEKDDSKSREMGNVRRLYEEELADVRKSLDGVAADWARLQIDHGNLCEDYQKLQARHQKKESDLANTVSQWKRVEASLTAKDAECSKLLSDNRRLQDDVADLQGQLENSVLSDAKNQLGSEILRRVDMENQVQTLREQLELQRNISEQEILEIRSRHNSRLVEVDSGRRREFESKLAQSIQQLRQEHESQMQQYKEEIEKTFSSKLENAQQAALEKSDVMLSTRDELESTKVRVEAISLQLQQCQKDKTTLEDRAKELERTRDRERELWQQKMNQKEQELLKTRSQMFSQLEDYENLLDVKLALDMEINAYRKMLEVEEQRLQLSPSPPRQTTVSRTHEHSSHKVRGKKRKYEGSTGSSPACKASSRSTIHSTVSLAEADVEGKYVMLKNNSEEVTFHLRGEDIDQNVFVCVCVCVSTFYCQIWAAGAQTQAASGDMVLQGHRSWGPNSVRVVLLNANQEVSGWS